jgi:hypothetical protein
VLGDAVGVELSPAPLRTLHQFRGVVLPDFHPVLAVHLLDAFLLETTALTATLPLPLLLLRGLLLWLLSLRRLLLLLDGGLLVVVSLGLFVFLRGSTLLFVVIGGVVLLHLVVDLLVRALLAAAWVWRVVVGVLVVCGGKIYFEGGVLLALGCWREGALEE